MHAAAHSRDGTHSRLHSPSLLTPQLEQYVLTAAGSHQAINRLQHGGIFMKHTTNQDHIQAAYRYFWCSTDLRTLRWAYVESTIGRVHQNSTHQPVTIPDNEVRGSLLIEQISDIVIGHSLLNEKCYCDASTCICINFSGKLLHLECCSAEERDTWVMAFTFLANVSKSSVYAQKMHAYQQQQANVAVTSPLTTYNQLCVAAQNTGSLSKATKVLLHTQPSYDGQHQIQTLRRLRFELHRWRSDIDKTKIMINKNYAIVHNEYQQTLKQHNALKQKYTALHQQQQQRLYQQQQDDHNSKYLHTDERKEGYSPPQHSYHANTRQTASVFATVH